MVDRYLDKGKMYVLDDIGAKCECVITDEGNGILEIKNIATVPEYQGKGYARALIEFVINNYRENTQFCKWEHEIVRFQSGFMKSVVLFAHTACAIFLQIITTTQSMKVEYSWWIGVFAKTFIIQLPVYREVAKSAFISISILLFSSMRL
ncbi:GNAT family N-acetyltransferase [Lactimicrobium massiliense]|uniref:GNAT family N-acetyltransferase n=1 Tax=Lactimicrobium massiliense TaxID=2161814 RepID=UPI001FDA3F84|nr:GNAT family N-acetyltransferase [Lactimicrobium massiliense]